MTDEFTIKLEQGEVRTEVTLPAATAIEDLGNDIVEALGEDTQITFGEGDIKVKGARWCALLEQVLSKLPAEATLRSALFRATRTSHSSSMKSCPRRWGSTWYSQMAPRPPFRPAKPSP
mmetsp:Transcript_14766/g.29653  ORF Transcript_14766/g.29653 Transcript_14766/m.29653 type:complete len:119 (+) Transcript_14766:97-453(+)